MDEEIIPITISDTPLSPYAHPGNQHAKKLTTSELKQKAFDAYCAWLAKGNVKKSFSFVDEDLWITSETLEKYIKDDPAEFDPQKISAAYAKGYAYWESIVNGSADGSNRKAYTPSLNMLMRNKFKWDQEKERANFDQENMTDLQRYSDERKLERSAPPPVKSSDHSD